MSLGGSAFQVEEAEGGQAGLAMLSEKHFDAVLLDINMPGLSGVEVCRKMRAAGMRTAVLMVTVRDSEDDKVRALNAGADDFITKPYRLRELIARLEAVLRRVAGAGSPEDTVLKAGAPGVGYRESRIEESGSGDTAIAERVRSTGVLDAASRRAGAACQAATGGLGRGVWART